MGAPRMVTGVVDVRVLALVHYKAGTTQNASGRYFTAAHETSFLDIGTELLPK